MTELSIYLSAATIGLLGSAHCIGMCGGITSALSLSLQGRSRTQTTWLMLSYHLGRISSYALAGLLLGLVGWYLGDSSRIMQLTMRYIAAGMLIAMGLYISGWWLGLAAFEKIGGHLWKHIQPRANRLLPIKKTTNALSLGALWGWLPCGMVYSTLTWSASQGQAIQSALLMACFGLGTLPSVFLTGLFAQQLRTVIQSKITRNIAGIMMILFGLWTLPGPHQAWIMMLFSSGHAM